MYLVIICEGFHRTGASSSSENGERATTLKYAWRSGTNFASIEVEWDRRDDLIKTGGISLPRANGNLIVIRRDPHGELHAHQFPSLPDGVSHADVLSAVQRQIPKDANIPELRF